MCQSLFCVFFKQKTAYEMRISDWSSDVCSSDLLVVLSHVGFPQDVQFAKDVPGIDVIVSGHTHNRMEHAIDVNGCLIFQSGCHGSFIGRLDLDLQDGELVSWKHALIAVDESVPPDQELEAAITKALAGEREAIAEEIGRASWRERGCP